MELAAVRDGNGTVSAIGLGSNGQGITGTGVGRGNGGNILDGDRTVGASGIGKDADINELLLLVALNTPLLLRSM